jgi:hypothetical protein
MHSDPPHLRRLACCQSEPECILCPLLPQNAQRSLRELATAGLRANLDAVASDQGGSSSSDAPAPAGPDDGYAASNPNLANTSS